jgi:hypothetical protein
MSASGNFAPPQEAPEQPSASGGQDSGLSLGPSQTSLSSPLFELAPPDDAPPEEAPDEPLAPLEVWPEVPELPLVWPEVPELPELPEAPEEV